MAQDINSSTSKLNPNPIKNYTPTQFVPQTPAAQASIEQPKVFFDYQRYVMNGPATPSNGYNAYPIRTPQYVSSLFADTNPFV